MEVSVGLVPSEGGALPGLSPGTGGLLAIFGVS